MAAIDAWLCATSVVRGGRDHPVRDGFYLQRRDDDEAFHARTLWDQTRDFVQLAVV